MKLTDEQGRSRDLFVEQGSLKIHAFAGTGKTSTLLPPAKSTRRTGLYLAFNRHVAVEAGRMFPTSVTCRTIHSLAFRAMAGAFKNVRGKMTSTMNAHHVANLLNLNDIEISLSPESGSLGVSRVAFGAFIAETVKRFVQSASIEIVDAHIPNWSRIQIAKSTSPDGYREFEMDTVERARNLWSMMTDCEDPAPLGHDGYLKLWSLGTPELPFDFIMLDEAQDTNPVALSVLRKQACQMVYVGDPHQQIYEWRGAINAMEEIETDSVSELTLSFRFGRTIAETASQVLSRLGEHHSLRRNDEIQSVLHCGTPDAVVCRTNGGVFQNLLDALEKGRRAFVVGGTTDLQRIVKGAQSLQQGRPSHIAEFFGFRNWSEVQEFSESEAGAEIESLVRLIDRFGCGALQSCLNRATQSPVDAEIALSTAHKAKGSEWSSVRIDGDFVRSNPSEEKSSIDPQYLRLVYVALTRAKRELEIPIGIIEGVNRDRKGAGQAPVL